MPGIILERGKDNHPPREGILPTSDPVTRKHGYLGLYGASPSYLGCRLDKPSKNGNMVYPRGAQGISALYLYCPGTWETPTNGPVVSKYVLC
jgi:hypothetical protein